MTYIKTAMVFLLLTFIIWSAFYSGLITKIKLLVIESNTWFIALVPTEWLTIIWIIIFILVIALAYAIFRE